MQELDTPEAGIPARFRARTARCGEALCMHDDQGGMTFATLDLLSDRLAVALQERGVQPGECVALLCGNGCEFVVAYLGILKAGATVVPINLLYSAVEARYVLRDSGARGLLHASSFGERASEVLAEFDAPLFRLSPDLAEPAGGTDAPLPRPCPCNPREDVAAILYTSGTTGHPKGAMLTHANLLANTSGICRALALSEEDRILLVLPMFHAFAATVGMLTPLLHRGAMIPLARFEPRQVSQAIARHRATIFLGVPSMFGVLARLDGETVAQWQSVRLCVSGGAAMSAALLAQFEQRFAIPILEGDGPTECGPVTCVNPAEGERRVGSIGLPIPSVEVTIRDEDGRVLPDGTHGEVCVRGPSVMKGYLGLPEATRASHFDDWFRTGDLGYRDADGYFYLVDRIKDMIITNGMNVYPRVVEEVLYAHPQVAEAAVVGDPDERHGEVPVAYVALQADATVQPADLRAWCRDRLGRHEVPRRIEILPALPRNAAGKILKRELRRSGEFERGVAPENP